MTFDSALTLRNKIKPTGGGAPRDHGTQIGVNGSSQNDSNRLPAKFQVECDTASDGHWLRVSTPRKPPRNVLDVFGNFVFLTHPNPGEKYYLSLTSQFASPRSDRCRDQGSGP
ncbi:hypothetical protein AAC387_Pa10g0579 [Persea americana]